MVRCVTCTVLLLALALVAPQSSRADNWLSADERRWIAQHPTVVLGTESGVEPAIIIHDDGSIEGSIRDFFDVVEEITGLNIEMRGLASGRHLQPDLPAGLYGFVPTTRSAVVLQKHTTMSTDIWNTLPVVFTRTDGDFDVNSLDDLRHRRIAHRASTATITQYLQPLANSSHIIPLASAVDGFTQLLEGNIDAYVGISTDSYQLTNYLIPNIKVAFADSGHPIQAGIAISNDHPLLLSILNKAVERIGRKRITELSGKWLNINPSQIYRRSSLSPYHQQWLNDHPQVTLGYIADFEPWLIEHAGRYSGILADVATELSRKLGIDIRIAHDSWEAITDKARTRAIDGLLLAPEKFNREFGLIPTSTVFHRPRIFYAVTEQKIRIRKPEDLFGKRILYYSQSMLTSPLLTPALDKVTLIRVSSPAEGITALLDGKGDILAGYSSDNFLLLRRGITNVKPVFLQSNPDKLTISVRNDWPELVDILDWALADIGNDRLMNIQRRWLGMSHITDTVLSARELAYISQLGPLRYDHRTSFPPIEFQDRHGKPAGIAYDYSQMIAERMGTQIDPIPNEDHGHAIQPLVDGSVDLSLMLQQMGNRESSLVFTDPYLSVPYVLIARNDVPIIKNIEELFGKSVGVIERSYAHRFLEKEYGTKINLIAFADLPEGFKAVNKGDIRGFIENEIFMDYSLRSLGEHNLKFAGTLPFTYSPTIAVRREQAELVPILNKVLSDITDRERALIYKRWANYPVDKPFPWQKYAIWVAIIFVLVLSLLVTIIYWNRKLLAARNEAEQANRAKTLFLANMSHEIRTPMNAILGFAEIIQQDKSLSGEHKHSLDVIRNAGNHLLALINDILDISKIEVGRIVINEDACHIHNLLRDLERMFLIGAQQKGLQLSIDGIDNLPAVILTDEGKLRQILINLIGNAVKFTQTGRVLCTCSCRSLDAEHVEIAIGVDDTGPGIDKHDLDKVFSTFEQTRTGVRTQGGTGLGMAISKAYAQAMGGDIALDSELGRGSRFTLTFQGRIAMIQEETANRSTAAGLDLAGNEYRILVVDDIQTNRNLAYSILAPMGFTLEEAEDGDKALEKFDAFQPHLVLMDIRMPGLDGIRATQQLRERDSAVPIIAMTAGVLDKDHSHIDSAGFTAFLDKPFKRSDLLTLLAEHLQLTPLYEEPTAPAAKTATVTDDPQERRVLIVDDVPVNRLLLEKQLAPRGLTCRQCENGAEALQAIAQWQPELVLLDIQMPVMDGYEVLAQLQQRPANQRPKIVALTATESVDENNRLLALGALAVFSKPIATDTIDHIVAEWLR